MEDLDWFYDRALEEARKVAASAEAGDGLPGDEIDALRSRLMVAFRRQPADARQLFKSAEVIARMEAAQHRMSPRKQEEYAANLERVLYRFGDIILPKR